MKNRKDTITRKNEESTEEESEMEEIFEPPSECSYSCNEYNYKMVQYSDLRNDWDSIDQYPCLYVINWGNNNTVEEEYRCKLYHISFSSTFNKSGSI